MIAQSCLLVVIALAVGTHAATYRVKGRLMCGDEPAKGVTLKLMDADGGILNGNDKLDEKVTDQDGDFVLVGSADDFGSSIDPYIKFYHRCNVGFARCPIKIRWNLPSSYTSSSNTYNFGQFNLAMRLKNTDHDCIH